MWKWVKKLFVGMGYTEEETVAVGEPEQGAVTVAKIATPHERMQEALERGAAMYSRYGMESMSRRQEFKAWKENLRAVDAVHSRIA